MGQILDKQRAVSEEERKKALEASEEVVKKENGIITSFTELDGMVSRTGVSLRGVLGNTIGIAGSFDNCPEVIVFGFTEHLSLSLIETLVNHLNDGGDAGDRIAIAPGHSLLSIRLESFTRKAVTYAAETDDLTLDYWNASSEISAHLGLKGPEVRHLVLSDSMGRFLGEPGAMTSEIEFQYPRDLYTYTDGPIKEVLEAWDKVVVETLNNGPVSED